MRDSRENLTLPIVRGSKEASWGNFHETSAKLRKNFVSRHGKTCLEKKIYFFCIFPPPRGRAAMTQSDECQLCKLPLPLSQLNKEHHVCQLITAHDAALRDVPGNNKFLLAGLKHLTIEQMLKFSEAFGDKMQLFDIQMTQVAFIILDDRAPLLLFDFMRRCHLRVLFLGRLPLSQCVHIQLSAETLVVNSPSERGQFSGTGIFDTRKMFNGSLSAKFEVASPQGSYVGASSGFPASPWSSNQEYAPNPCFHNGLYSNDCLNSRTPSLPQVSSYQPISKSAITYNPADDAMGRKPPSTNDWQCDACNNINFSFRRNCHRCHAPRLVPQTEEALERRICKFTVMLVRVPLLAKEEDIVACMSTFGPIVPGGIKFHCQGKHSSYGHQDYKAMHAFVPFVSAESATSALKQGKVYIFGQWMRVNPAFVRGTLSSRTQ